MNQQKQGDNRAGEIVDGEGIDGDQLGWFLGRIMRLEEEKVEIAANVREVYAEAKSQGFDVKTIKSIVAIRKKDTQEVDEQEVMIHIYKQVLGMKNAICTISMRQ